VPTILFDEGIDGYRGQLTQRLFSPEWADISAALQVRIVGFEDVGLERGSSDADIWELCQLQQIYLLTDNRNQDGPNSLEATIRAKNQATSVPVFTVSDIQRFRFSAEYVEAVATKLLEYLFDAANIRGSGRLYLP
jgi:hypothetical protein